MKTMTSITLDVDLLVKIRNRKLNLSQIVNNYLIEYFSENNDEDISSLKQEEKLLDEKINLLRTQILIKEQENEDKQIKPSKDAFRL